MHGNTKEWPKKRIIRTKLEDLQQYDLGGGERIPALEDVILLLEDSPNTLLVIELKDKTRVADKDIPGPPPYQSRCAEKVLEIVNQYNVWDKVMFASFKPGFFQ